MKKLTRRIVIRVVGILAILLHELQLFRLRSERALSRILPGNSGRIRVLATACWHFPIYSHTFVYQEMTDLIRNHFSVRFIYGKKNPKSMLPDQFLPLWRCRRRVIMNDAVCNWACRAVERRYPVAIEQLITDLYKRLDDAHKNRHRGIRK